MPGKFELKASKNGKFHFNLKASNGQVVLSSELYETRRAAENGIAAVRKNAGNEKRFERRETKDGKAYFVLTAGNGEIVGKSERFLTKERMETSISTVKKAVETADISS